MTNEITAAPKRDMSKRSKSGQVTGKLKQACDLIVYEGLAYNEAAAKVGLTVRAMRYAIGRPAVLAYLKAERQVLLTAIRAENPRRLRQLRDQDVNRGAAVRAAAVIEGLGEDAERAAVARTPGVVIQIVNQAPAAPRVIDVTPAREGGGE